ncbi:MAG: hypothetical protein ACC652_06895 [Acidimicrobiales bacterium]
MNESAGQRDRGHGLGGRRRHSLEVPAVTEEDLRAWFAETSKGDGKLIAATARIEAFNEQARLQRITIAERAQQKFLREVSWAQMSFMAPNSLAKNGGKPANAPSSWTLLSA